VFEEPLFRGFLWGYLRQARWKNGTILIFQAALFTLGHVYHLREEALGPWLLRMLLPSLLLGFVAWRAQSITASMVTHGFLNGSADMLMHTSSESGAIHTALRAMACIAALYLCGEAARRWRNRSPKSTGRDGCAASPAPRSRPFPAQT